MPAVKLEIDDLIDENNRQVEDKKEDLLQQDSTIGTVGSSFLMDVHLGIDVYM